MSDGQPTIRIIKQVKPAGGSLVDVLVVPLGQHILVQKVVLSNNGSGAEKVTLAVALLGVLDSSEQHLLNEYSLGSHDFVVFEPAVTLDSKTVVRVQTEGDVVVTILGANT